MGFPARSRDVLAVGRERRAGDEAGVVAGKKHHAARHLLGLAQAPDRDQRQYFPAVVRREFIPCVLQRGRVSC
jgi:hypothetical protein